MPERRLFPEFRDQYERTRFPFADSALLSPTNADMQDIDNDMFLDASLYPIGAVGGLYISKITVATGLVEITIADSTASEVAAATFDPLTPPAVLRCTDALGRPAGILVSEASRLSRFSAWAVGVHTYRATSTPFTDSCVIPTPEVGVRGILTEQGDLFTRDVLIVGDNGVVVREDGDGVIRVDIVGDPLYVRTLCDPLELFNTPRFIQTVNGCPPDAQGNFQITVGDHLNAATIIRVYPNGDGVVIEAVGQTIQRLT